MYLLSGVLIVTLGIASGQGEQGNRTQSRDGKGIMQNHFLNILKSAILVALVTRRIKKQRITKKHCLAMKMHYNPISIL